MNYFYTSTNPQAPKSTVSDRMNDRRGQENGKRRGEGEERKKEYSQKEIYYSSRLVGQEMTRPDGKVQNYELNLSVQLRSGICLKSAA